MAKLKKVYLGIIILFLYAPILVLIAQSFNASRYRGQWTGFTLQWYEKLFTSEDIIEAFLNTLTIGLTAAFFATLLGLVTARPSPSTSAFPRAFCGPVNRRNLPDC